MNIRTNAQPVRGLPEKLPEGEHIVWQGSPAWKTLARRMFRFRLLAIYFLILIAWRVASSLNAGAKTGDIAVTALESAALAAVAFVVLAVIAWLIQRTTIYTITNKRVVMRYGVALPMAINLPFKAMASADARIHPDDTGDICLILTGKQRISHLSLWPHARPWKLRQPQPMLRCIPEVSSVAETLVAQLSAAGLEPIIDRETAKPDQNSAKPEPVSAPHGSSPVLQN